MSIMNLLTRRTMGMNRVRTIVTIIGIILSTAMFTAVITICTSLYGALREGEIAQSGSFHIHAFSTNRETVAPALEDGRTEYAAFAKDVGYAVIGSENPNKPYLFILAADETFMREMPVHLTSGRMPENSTEVLIPDHLYMNGGVDIPLGETLTLDLGERTSAEFGSLWQNIGYQVGAEELTDTVPVRCTVVGKYARPDFEPYSAPGYTALTVMDGEPDADSAYEVFIRVKNPRKNYVGYSEEHTELYAFGSEDHSGLLQLEGVTRYGNISAAITNFAIILSVLIFAGSVCLIYSAFSISVSERTKQFGLLSSVGATHKQIRRSVLYEACALSAIGIPVGAAAGVGGIALTLYLLRGKFGDLLGSSYMSMHLAVTPACILLAAAIAFVTVLVSAWIPSVRAMRISPIEAIRQSRDIKAKESGTGRPRLAAKLFGAEGLLADKYYSRSRKKYRATIISLAMSVILFVAASGFCLYMTRSAASVDNRPGFDLYYEGVPADEFARIRSAAAAEGDEFAGYSVDFDHVMLYLPDESTTPEYRKYYSAAYGDSVMLNAYAQIRWMDDESFRELIKTNGLDEAAFFDPEHPRAIALNHASVPVYSPDTRENYVFNFLKSGVTSVSAVRVPAAPEGYEEDCVAWSGSVYGEGEITAYYSNDYARMNTLYDEMGRPKGLPTAPVIFEECEIGAMLEYMPVGAFPGSYLSLIYPVSQYRGENTDMSLFLRCGDTLGTIAALTGIMEDAGITVEQNRFFDATENARQMTSIITIIKVFSYGFITLISLISVANVFNTVTTNVALRRRDYAMLRSMGMTARGMNRMSNFECLIYGSRSLLIGLPIAVGVTYLVHLAADGAAHMSFTLPWAAMAIAVVSVFLVVFISMLYSTGKLKKDNPIDALKNENV